MNELYQSLGLKNNLFSKFSAEEEEEYLNDIYVQPKYFNSLYSNLKGASSRFIIGSRGSGKTALILQLKKSLEENNVYTFLLDNFENIPNKDNERHFILEIIQGITSEFSLTLSKNPKLLKNLDTFEKEKLSFIIQEFFKTLSKREYLERNEKVKRFKTKNAFLEFFNSYLNKPVNLLVSGGIEIISDTVAKSLGLPKVQNEEFYKNYIPEFKTKIPEKKISFDNYDYNSLKNILIDLSKIIRKVGYHSVVIMIDKIDENRNLRGSINDVCNFIEEILKDTNLLMQSDFGIVFSIWDEVRNVLASRGVRFDKFRPIDVTWTSEEIIEIINKRIGFFSDKTNNIQDLLVDANEKDEIIKLANNSPRDLFHLFANIYDEQSVIDSNSEYFSREAINNGKLKFCKEYEYYALFPSNRNSKDDVFRNINRLLKTGKITLRSNDIASVLKVNPATANTYIKIMSDFNFIKMTEEQYLYNIIDPKIKYLIENKIIEI